MTATNNITGDHLRSKAATDEYRDGFDRIFGKKPIKAIIDELPKTCRKCPADPKKVCDYCGWRIPC